MSPHSCFRRAGRLLGLAVAFVLPPLLVGAASFSWKLHVFSSDRGRAGSAAADPASAYDPGRPTVVLLASNRATEVTDLLPPYEIFAATGRLNVLLVAPERRPSPLFNRLLKPTGVAVVPHLSFAEYERLVGRDPDVIVLPYYPGFDGRNEPELVAWSRAHAGARRRLQAVCAGAEILAATGLLDGHRVTTHWAWLDRLEKRHPEVRWERGVRYVADGRIVTSAGLTSGVDASLATVDRLLGREAALAAARRVGYTQLRFLDDPRAQVAGLDLRTAPDIVFRLRSPRVAVVLAEGVSESALAATLDASTTSLTRMSTAGTSAAPVRGRFGLMLLPEATLAQPPVADRVVLLGAASGGDLARATTCAAAADLPLDRLASDTSRFGYGAILEDLGRQEGLTAAQSAARNLIYPADSLELGTARWPWGWTKGVSLGLLSCTLLAAVPRRRRRDGSRRA